MSQWNGNSDAMHELAQLPPGDRRRAELEDRLLMMSAAEQLYWREQLKLTDRIYAEINMLDPSSAMQRSLLAIPDTIAQPLFRRILRQPVGWPHLAAAMVALVMLTGAMLWHLSPSRPPQIPALNTAMTNGVASMAVFLNSAPLQIAQSDPTKLQQQFQQLHLPFTPVVPQPSVELKLEGGGMIRYQSAPVIYTRWTGPDSQYTLFQFNGNTLGIPASFALTASSLPGHADNQLNIWPGADGQGTWALLIKGPRATNVFMDSCR